MSTAVKSPTYRTGKICYIEIPAKDIKESADFINMLSDGRPDSEATARPLLTTPSTRSAVRGSSGGLSRLSPD